MSMLSKDPPREGSRNRWLVLATMTGALSMIMIDQTVVGVALPTMRHDLALSATGVQWVVDAYLLLLAVLVAFGGRLGDMLGPERTFRVGVGVFIVASAMCGLAQNEAWVIAARGLQGAGAALMVPATGAIVINAFAPGERGRAMGIYTGCSMICLALGPLVGGVLTEAVSWRAVFFVNLPVGLVTLIAAARTLPRASTHAGARGSLDPLGLTLLIVVAGALVLALMQGQTWGWGSPKVIGLLALSVVLAPPLVRWELRHPHPILELSLLRQRTFAVEMVVLAGVQFALTGISVYGAIWVQDSLGYGPIAAGLSLLPLTLLLLPVSPIAGRLNDRHGPRWLLATGTLLLAGALVWLALVLHKQSYPWLIPGYMAIGIALGLAISPASTDALSAGSREQRSQVAGLTQMLRQLGGAIGTAVLGTIIAGHTGAGSGARGLTSGTADAYWAGAAVLVPVAIAAILLIRRGPLASAVPAGAAGAEATSAAPDAVRLAAPLSAAR